VKVGRLIAAAGLLACFAAAAQPADPKALRLAIEDLTATHGDRYAGGRGFADRLAALESREAADGKSPGFVAEMNALGREALLANPLLDFDQLLVVRRGEHQLGLPQNWQGNCALPPTGYRNEIAAVSPRNASGKSMTVFQPEGGRFIGDVDLHSDGARMLFSMPDGKGRWAVWEMRVNGTGLSRVSPADGPEADWYDPCYLPDGRIIFAGTACFQGVPCVGGGNRVANLYLLDPASGRIRQLTFDQDHDWCPTVLNNGRVLYTRWEYSDSPHYFTRILFSMNPDGTEQAEFYGSNSYWPNSLFYARPVPGHPSKIVAIVSGHHGVARMGELVLLDPAQGRRENTGVVQRIPGRGRLVPARIEDQLVADSWPKFLHPFPLSEKYFLVSCQPDAGSRWGIYLVDVFDNRVLIHEEPGMALLEPLPLRASALPPAIADKVDPAQTEAVVYLQDVYAGPGLQGVPRGAVKRLRIYELHFAYPQMGGHINIGIDGPWDARRILGTVAVNADGSAAFRVPANRPLAVQPLDAEGKALQVMRSWFTAMPGEQLSCVGCHESRNSAPGPGNVAASTQSIQSIEPWYGPARPFSFIREVQPVLDRNCVGCHNGETRADGKVIPNFDGRQPDAAVSRKRPAKRPRRNIGPFEFDAAYAALHPYVRRPGPESDYHLQAPAEWHADTSELVQLIKQGHYGVSLSAEDWDRLITWIDLKVPDHGTWGEHRPIPGNYRQQRLAAFAKFAGRTEDPETYPMPEPVPPTEFPRPTSGKAVTPEPQPKVSGWPFTGAEAKQRQAKAGLPELMKLPLSAGLAIELTLIPAGDFVMGAAGGREGGSSPCTMRIDKPFYLGKFEVSNEEFAAFNPGHDSGYISAFNKDQTERGFAVNKPRQPVLRVSFEEALRFCRWLTEKTGRHFSLPTEAQWEWACRAGTDTPWAYGADGGGFIRFANLADGRLLELCRGDSPKWIPALGSVNDGAVVADRVGRYQPNAWGLYDMHGNVAEWTLPVVRSAEAQAVARGGSFYDRPQRAMSSTRICYPSWQRVFNVGFRVACEAAPAATKEVSQARVSQ
jgi:formylglycine-generating enzyme required for sulfatase activity